MVSRRRFLALLGGSVVAAGGVVVGANALPGEARSGGMPIIRLGGEQCAYCGMTIGDARFAAAWRTQAGAERHFDDIGCMVNAARREAPGDGTRFFVHDYADQSWLDGASATYVLAPSIRTPMAYGVAAFANAESARAFDAGGQALAYAWSDLPARVERKG